MTTVMVVDDEAPIRELVRLYLEDEGMEVVEKANGEEAWQYYNKLEYEHLALNIRQYRLDEQIRNVIITSEPQWSAINLDIELELAEIAAIFK
ncbi:response regulator [Cohnella nanjingensis]|uniref:response regulator n=1 Tax=Cohnella nanjingensis TaxID=1387779 RepID=UPI001C889FB5|nr:response regulator [Cohnella nanjingensis]